MHVDTDIIIWYMRGNQKAKSALEALDGFSISAVVYMEVLQGIINKTELRAFRKFIINNNIRCLAINEEISSHAIYLLEEHVLSNGLKMADALIAATADVYGEVLFTGNYAHYKMLPTLTVKRFKPD